MSKSMSPVSTSLQLMSCHIIERTLRGEFLWTWSYPILTSLNRLAYTKKCRLLLNELKNSGYQFFHQGDNWVYVRLVTAQDPSPDFVAIVLVASDFNPERYETLSKILVQKYSASASQPSSILQTFLSIQTTSKCMTLDNDTFYFHEYDGHDFFRHPKLRGIIETFGVEVILIYTSLLLNKRILVYHHDISRLYEFCLSLPAFVQHRPNVWQVIYPLVENSDAELSIFQDSHFHILGCTDEQVWNRTELYDLYINIPAAEVLVAPHARESLTMTKTHKDIALFMLQLCEKQSFTERDIMQEIGRKTKDLIENLRIFVTVDEGGRETLSLKELRSREFSPTLESFLIGLAQAENVVVRPEIHH